MVTNEWCIMHTLLHSIISLQLFDRSIEEQRWEHPVYSKQLENKSIQHIYVQAFLTDIKLKIFVGKDCYFSCFCQKHRLSVYISDFRTTLQMWF